MHKIIIHWNHKNNTMAGWNDTCASIIEHFGLPGDRYVTEVTADNMTFNFKTEQDAFMCKVLVSDRL